MTVNRVILVGRLGKDPELRYTPSGTAVCKFSLATDEAWRDQSGQLQRRTEWHNIVAWTKLAETCQKLLTKGKQIYVEGRIQTRQWDDRDGNKRTTTEIVIATMRLLGSRAEAAAATESAVADREAVPASPMAGPEEPSAEPAVSDEDIPF
jgi:single-strand DNA-binding protein